jgi:eukaryotic-like serine/threonine-protein kinase
MTPTTTSTCPTCGGAVLPGDRFCGSCGNPVVAGVTSQRPQSRTVGPAPTAVGVGGDTSPWAAVAARLQTATLGEFEIVTELGRGGMAAVYLAKDLSLNRRVAIKVMAPGLLLGQGMIERFRQEAVTVANLQHAHIVSIHAVRQIEDLHFFVMQFVPGRTLEGVLRDGGGLPIAVVRAWLYQVGAALGYAHRRGVIHRDIKPGNILLNADGEAVVTDFGIAKVAESPSHTQTGTVVGTPVYMSPEQCFARELTGASDQYSLGIVAYEMLAGRPPFSGSSFALMRSHTDEAPPPLRDVRPDVPPSMEAALMRMLAKKPDERFATLSEALVALGATALAPDDPLHATLQQYAAASERLKLLGDVLRTPASPVPKTRERQQAGSISPRPSAPATQALVVVVAAPPSDLEPGAALTLRATVKNSAGQIMPGSELQWSSSAPSIVSVDASTGAIKALAKGTATITAAAETARDAVDVVVGEPRAANIILSAPPGALAVGERVRISAAVTSRYDVRVARPIQWSVDDPSIASIERDPASPGATSVMVRATAGGATGIVALCDGAIGRVPIRVAAPVTTEPARPHTAPTKPEPMATPPATATALLTPTPPASAAAPPPIATTPDATAPSGTRVWRWAVPAVVLLGAIGYFVFKPSATAAPSGNRASQPKDSSGVVARDTSVVATTRDSTVVGDTIDAVDPPPRDSATTTRTDSIAKPPAAPVARRIELQPTKPPAIAPGQTLALSARVRDQAGAAMPNVRVVWSSGDPRVAVVDPGRGIVNGVGAGAARITARVGSVVSAVTVTVVPLAPDPTIVASVEVAEIRTLTVGETTRLTAAVRNAAGGALSNPIDWSSSNPDVATVAQGGVITARGPGVATIRATSGGRSAERAVTVRAREVVTRADTPAATSSSTNTATKSEAELRADIQAVISTYARAIQTRDTSLIRRVYPNADAQLMRRWQTTFDDARGPIQLTGGSVEILDTPRDAAGAQVQTRAKYSARFASRAARSDQSFPVTFTAIVQREGGTWRIMSIR